MATKIKALSERAIKRVFGAPGYREVGGGRVKLDAGWISGNIVACSLEGARRGKTVTTECHRLAKEPLERAFREVQRKGLSGLIRAFDGLWVPRHKCWNPSRGLSSHTWGIAFDLNAETNGYGCAASPENLALNEIFGRYGFAWGGHWTPDTQRDPMHWELAQVDAWKEAQEPKARASLILGIARGSAVSYHRIASAELVTGAFMVDRMEVAELLGRSAAPGRSAIRELLSELDVAVTRTGDHLRDAVDPRVYLFVKA